jgi:hypothetical protein
MSLSPKMHDAIAPNIDATKFYYPNQEPPAAFLASFRRSVWKSSVSFFSGLAYKGFGNLWWTYPFFFTVPIRPFEKENGQSMLIRIWRSGCLWREAWKQAWLVHCIFGGGSEGRFVLEVVLTHFLVVVIPTHTFDTRIGKILTRIEVLWAALPVDRLVFLRFGKEDASRPYVVNCCSAFFHTSFSASVVGSFALSALAMVEVAGIGGAAGLVWGSAWRFP